MLWFNDYFNFLLDKKIAFQYILCCGSTPFNTLFLLLLLSFQYILCCGSTAFKDTYVTISQYFNTSYVVVQRNQRNRTVFCTTISIHLMLWFNIVRGYILWFKWLFQYILCCGSTSFCLIYQAWYQYFNTSYVVVQLKKCFELGDRFVDFNTSYVVVQQKFIDND